MIQSSSRIVLFDGYECATQTYVYNASNGNAATSGWVRAVADNVVVQVCLATLTATTFSYRIEGRYNSSSRAASVHADALTAAHTIDELVNITEKFPELRVGVKVDNTEATNFFYSSILLTTTR